MKKIDLRSDTVTLPTEEMYKAIEIAKLGDSGRGDDPTVNELEKKAANKLGMEDALLTPSGTMSNLIAMMVHTKRGEGILLGKSTHIYLKEFASLSYIAGLMPILLEEKKGMINLQETKYFINSKHLSFKPGLVILENTHNCAGGTVISPEEIYQVSEIAHKNNLPVHIDGARIFNAAVAIHINVKEFTKHIDSICFCLSKGLSAPIGSLLVGKKEFIEKARPIFNVLGGKMRQAGIIAAPGIVALEKMVDRLEEDHNNAKLLAKEISLIKGLNIDLSTVQTNIIRIDVSEINVNSSQFANFLEKKGVLVLPFDDYIVRMVTHKDISSSDIDYTIERIKKIINEMNL